MSPGRQTKMTIALLGLLTVLIGAYWFVLSSREDAREEAIEAKRIFDFEPGDVTTIEIMPIDEDAYVAVRTAGRRWSIHKPSGIEANQIVWSRMATAIADLSIERLVESKGEDLGRYGLDEPRLQIIAGAEGGRVIQLSFGNDEPTGRYTYAQVGGGEIFLVSNTAFFELNRPPEQLRETLAFDAIEGEITRLKYARVWTGNIDDAFEASGDEPPKLGDESVLVILHKGEDSLWRLIEPEHAKANQARVAELVGELQYARGRNYIDAPESLNDYGLNPPAARITVQGGNDGSKQTLLLGWLDGDPASGGVFVKREGSPAVFVIDSHLLTLLPHSPNDMRDKRLLTRDVGELTAMTYRNGDAPAVHFEYENEKGWGIAELSKADTSQVAISSFISQLKSIEGKDFPRDVGDKETLGLEPAVIEVSFKFKGEEKPVMVRIGGLVPAGPEGARENDRRTRYAQQDTGDVVTILGGYAELLSRRLFDFREKNLFRAKGGDITRVGLTFDGVDYVFERPRAKWLVAEPAGKELESQSDMETILNALGGARMMGVEISARAHEKMLRENPEALLRYGLDAPRLVASLTIQQRAGGEILAGPLNIGAVTPDNSRERFATMKPAGDILRIRQDLIDDIREGLRGVRDQ